ncbi:MAG: hypothetical protein JNL85_00710 [Rubrivivax sp.]|nr:hypothetical protein [Rubrivivax sp.]
MSDPELTAALERIERSRRHLHAELLPPPEDHERHGSRSGTLAGRWLDWLHTGPLHTWVELAEPWIASGSLVVQRWWRRQPWHDAAVLVVETGREALSPVIRRHPLAAVGIAATAGAALVMARPWRHPHAQRVANGSVRQARRWLVRQLANPVLHTVLATAFTSLAAAATPPRRGADAQVPGSQAAAAAAAAEPSGLDVADSPAGRDSPLAARNRAADLAAHQGANQAADQAADNAAIRAATAAPPAAAAATPARQPAPAEFRTR